MEESKRHESARHNRHTTTKDKQNNRLPTTGRNGNDRRDQTWRAKMVFSALDWAPTIKGRKICDVNAQMCVGHLDPVERMEWLGLSVTGLHSLTCSTFPAICATWNAKPRHYSKTIEIKKAASRRERPRDSLPSARHRYGPCSPTLSILPAENVSGQASLRRKSESTNPHAQGSPQMPSSVWTVLPPTTLSNNHKQSKNSVMSNCQLLKSNAISPLPSNATTPSRTAVALRPLGTVNVRSATSPLTSVRLLNHLAVRARRVQCRVVHVRHVYPRGVHRTRRPASSSSAPAKAKTAKISAHRGKKRKDGFLEPSKAISPFLGGRKKCDTKSHAKSRFGFGSEQLGPESRRAQARQLVAAQQDRFDPRRAGIGFFTPGPHGHCTPCKGFVRDLAKHNAMHHSIVHPVHVVQPQPRRQQEQEQQESRGVKAKGLKKTSNRGLLCASSRPIPRWWRWRHRGVRSLTSVGRSRWVFEFPFRAFCSSGFFHVCVLKIPAPSFTLWYIYIYICPCR